MHGGKSWEPLFYIIFLFYSAFIPTFQCFRAYNYACLLASTSSTAVSPHAVITSIFWSCINCDAAAVYNLIFLMIFSSASFLPHRFEKHKMQMLPIVTVVSWFFCMSLCTSMSYAELIEMAFGLLPYRSPRNHVLMRAQIPRWKGAPLGGHTWCT